MRTRTKVLVLAAALALAACRGAEPVAPQAPAPSSPHVTPPRPCVTVQGGGELRVADAQTFLVKLAANVRLTPADEALRQPTSIQDLKAILRRDLVYFYPAAAAYARSLGTLDGAFAEAQIELLLGDAMLVASQVLTNQEAWVGPHLRVARANLAGEDRAATTDRGRLLGQLIQSVEEGNTIAAALGIVAPVHVARGADLVRRLRKEAPNDVRTAMLLAEYHRLRGEWSEFERAVEAAERAERAPSLCYLRAMEKVERYRDKERGSLALRECLRLRPRFVRAQAALVLASSQPDELARELASLKAMDEDHYLVMLLLPTLEADRELSRLASLGGPDARP